MKIEINRYNFQDLLEAAERFDAPQEAIDALGEWFERYGMNYWNGECFDASAPGEPRGDRPLYPIYGEEDENGDFPLLRYSWAREG